MRHHKRARAANWEVNDIELMFCIQTRALHLEEQMACPKGADYYPCLRAAHASTSNANDAAGVSDP